MQGMKDPYEDQLSAARFKAERDVALQELGRMRPAFEWVEEHGGLEKIRQQRINSYPRDAYERKRGKLLKHIAECEKALGKRKKRVEELEAEAKGMRERIETMFPRLMPEGMEWLVEAWPRFEDGEPVRVGDEVELHTGRMTVEAVEFSRGKVCIKDAEDGDWSTSSYAMHPLKRPAPKVLDADGVEIREGDTVWDEHGDGLVVLAVYGQDVHCRYAEYEDQICDNGTWEPSQLTHRAPVLAADGKPLRVGETLWVTRDSPYDAPLDKDDEVTVRHAYSKIINVEDETGELWIVHADYLTHERPDSWGRLGEDVSAIVDAERNGEGSFIAANAYCERHGLKDGTVWVLVAQDLVRRAKKLAGGDAS